MFLFANIPLTARPTYFHHLRAEIFNGVRGGVTSISLVAAIAAKSLGASDNEVACLASAGGLGMIASMLIGQHIRTHPKLPYVVVPWFISNVLLLGVAFVTSVTPFVVLVSLSILFHMLSTPAFTGIQRSNYPASHRATIMGFIRARSFLLLILVSLITGVVLEGDPNGFRYLVPAAGAFGLLSTFRLMRMKVRGERHLDEATDLPAGRTPPGGFGEVLRDRRFLGFEASCMCFGFGNLMLLPVLPLLLVHELKIDYGQIALALAVLPGLFMVLTVGAWGRLLDRWNPLAVRALTTAIWCLEPLLIFMASPLAAALGVGAVTVVFLARCLRGMVQGGSGLVWHLGVMYFAREDNVTVYMGLHNALTGVRFFVAPLIGAALARSVGYRHVFLIAGGIMAIGLLIILHLVLRERRRGRLRNFAEQEAIASVEAVTRAGGSVPRPE